MYMKYGVPYNIYDPLKEVTGNSLVTFADVAASDIYMDVLLDKDRRNTIKGFVEAPVMNDIAMKGLDLIMSEDEVIGLDNYETVLGVYKGITESLKCHRAIQSVTSYAVEFVMKESYSSSFTMIKIIAQDLNKEGEVYQAHYLLPLFSQDVVLSKNNPIVLHIDGEGNLEFLAPPMREGYEGQVLDTDKFVDMLMSTNGYSFYSMNLIQHTKLLCLPVGDFTVQYAKAVNQPKIIHTGELREDVNAYAESSLNEAAKFTRKFFRAGQNLLAPILPKKEAKYKYTMSTKEMNEVRELMKKGYKKFTEEVPAFLDKQPFVQRYPGVWKCPSYENQCEYNFDDIVVESIEDGLVYPHIWFFNHDYGRSDASTLIIVNSEYRKFISDCKKFIENIMKRELSKSKVKLNWQFIETGTMDEGDLLYAVREGIRISDPKYNKYAFSYSESIAEPSDFVPAQGLGIYIDVDGNTLYGDIEGNVYKDKFDIDTLNSTKGRYLLMYDNRTYTDKLMEGQPITIQVLSDTQIDYSGLYMDEDFVEPGDARAVYAEANTANAVGRTIEKAKSIPKNIIEKADKLISKIREVAVEFRRADDDKLRERIINDEFVPILDNSLKYIIGGVTAYGLYFFGIANPLMAVLGGLGAKQLKQIRDKERREKALKMIKDELEILDEKINDAKSRDDRKEKYALMRIKQNLEGKLLGVTSKRKYVN